MRTRVMVAISGILMVVIMATMLSYTLAWYPANGSEVYGDNGLFKTDDTEIASIPLDIHVAPYVYSGETGLDTELGAEDYPYRAVTSFTMELKPQSEGYVVTAQITGANVKLKDYNEETGEGTIITSAETPEIVNNFAWDIYLVTPNEEAEAHTYYYPAWYFGKEGDGWYDSKETLIEDTTFKHYFPSECFGSNDGIIRDVDGNMFELTNVSEVKEYLFVVCLTFLDRDSYCLFLEETKAEHPTHEIESEERKAFAYCDYAYMNSTFEIFFDVGFTAKITEQGE